MKGHKSSIQSSRFPGILFAKLILTSESLILISNFQIFPFLRTFSF